MRWFKHLADLRDDEAIAEYLDRCGRDRLAAYGFFLSVIEIICAAMDPKTSRAAVRYPTRTWCRRLGVHALTLQKHMEYLRGCRAVNVKLEDGCYEVEFPNLLKLRDEYSRKSGHAPEDNRSESHQSRTDTDTDTDTEASPTTSDPAKPWSRDDMDLKDKVHELLRSPSAELLCSDGDFDPFKVARNIRLRDRRENSEPSENEVNAAQRFIKQWRAGQTKSPRAGTQHVNDYLPQGAGR